MNLLNWLRHPRRPIEADQDLDREKLSLQQELAQHVVTFDRRRYRVHEIAVQAVKSMREGQGR